MIWEVYRYKLEAKEAASKHRARGAKVRVRKHKGGGYEVISAKNSNPAVMARKRRKKTLTIRNAASVTVKQLPTGQALVTVKRNKARRRKR